MKKEPKKHLVKKTNARILAEKNPHTKVPDSEICIENIIPGSPLYIPYKHKKRERQYRFQTKEYCS